MTPNSINYRKKSAILELDYADGHHAELSAEYLRVYSPSAEVKGHHPSQAVLQTGKQWVQISKIEPIGNYAIQIHFDDNHNSGLYSWEYLWDLHQNKAEHWQAYLSALNDQGGLRDPNQQVVTLIDPKA